VPFLSDLLRKADNWGVLEVAFGGGEPLLFPGFVELLHELHETTQLGINFTTNGMLLTPAILADLAGAWQEVRLSAYEDNHYRRSMRLLQGHNFGINWLVTPRNVGMIEPFVKDFLGLGARNVLLLGYKGIDPTLHLSSAEVDVLKRAVSRLEHLPLRLDICWYPLFPDLPHLFARKDCGAGDEFLVITPDQAIQPCSFHHERIPFDSFDELKAIYLQLRARRPATSTPGCTRTLFPLVASPETKPQAKVFIWQAHGSNNSGDWTIVGRFRTSEAARNAAESLRELARAHEAYLASADGQEWLKANGYNGSIPTPPLRQFGEQHGFDWSKEGEGLWWEEDGCGAPVLTAGSVGDSVVVYHPYCMGLPEEPFRWFFTAVGAKQFGYWQYDRPCVVATARGQNVEAINELQQYLDVVTAAEYPSDVKTPPPWGEVCDDPRVEPDEDQNTRLDRGIRHVEVFEDSVRITLSFANTFAGSLAVEAWLRKAGFEQIEIQLQANLQPFEQSDVPIREPKTGLFGDVRPLAKRLESTTPDQVVEMVFNYWSVPEPFKEALTKISDPQKASLCQRQWEACRANRDVTVLSSQLIQLIGAPAASWTRAFWNWLTSNQYEVPGVVLHALAASLPLDEGFALAKKWASQAPNSKTMKERLLLLVLFKNPEVVPLVEDWWRYPDVQESATLHWATLVATSGLSWETARHWLEGGRPLSLIALDVLNAYYEAKNVPAVFHCPTRREFLDVLQDYQTRDAAPRPSRIIQKLVADPTTLVQ